MNAPDALVSLVEKFERSSEAYRSKQYNETQVRIDFINPLFEILGWDVSNSKGQMPAYQDVVHEDAIKVGGAHKAPDYGFRVGGARKFFVEAKKPSENILDNPLHAFQLRRYAWSAKLPLSILTDFEEFAIYDCRIAPDQHDRPSIARLNFIPYIEYPDRWEELESLFSKEAVLAGSLDAYAEAAKTKRGTATVDAVFLREIETWREALARDIAEHNPTISRRELNYAVQMTIDRIIFLRMTEDRGIEEYGRLQGLLNGGHVYARLREFYRQADERYNSGLFHFHKERDREEGHDNLTPNLDVGDDTLKGIFNNLYYPQSPYEFAVLPVEVLGQVYEQFLGKVIDLGPDRSVTIEEKPEVRKAGGVYYTPKYIVDYIVEHTVGKLLEGKKPGPRGAASKLKIVDPACGSGSFLIGAYEYLLDWHRDRYLEAGPEKHTKELYKGLGGQWLLTTGEKKRILLNNIYGVDIDPQAVEVTKLSLLLKVLEGESSESLVTQLSMFRERALPDLGNNIKCGNSLVGPDFYNTGQMSFLDPEEQYRINIFDWKSEYPQVFAGNNPGFDAVVGNPPYVNIRIMSQIQGADIMEYFKANYMYAFKGYDLYVIFIERSLSLLSKYGQLGMIVPNKIATLDYALECRRGLITQSSIRRMADVSNLKVFGSTGVYPYILIAEKGLPLPNHQIDIILPASPGELAHDQVSHGLLQSTLSAEGGLTIHGTLNIEKRVPTEPLASLSVLHSGTTGFSAQETASNLIERDRQDVSKTFDFIVSGNIDRYRIRTGDVRFMKRKFIDPVLPLNTSQLTNNKIDLYTSEKIVIAGMTKRLESAYDSGGLALGVQVYAATKLKIDYPYVLGILNSSLLSYLFRMRFQAKHLAGGFLAINKGQLSLLPIRTLDKSIPSQLEMHERMIALVGKIQLLQVSMDQAKMSSEASVIQRQIEATDRQIDRLVYQLYELTDDEIVEVEAELASTST